VVSRDYEYYTSRSEAYKVYTDGGMVVPGQWFVDNSKNPKKSEASISNTKRMMSAVFALNLGWKNQVYLDVSLFLYGVAFTAISIPLF